MSNETADLIVVASTVHTMAADAPPVSVLAIRDGRIAATAGPDGRRDLLAAWRGPGTVVIDDAGLVVLPAFVDTHNHLMLAAQNILGVPVSQAADIPGIVSLIRQRAAQTPPGQWIRTGADWHELRLAERRLPTAAELDEATTDHPVLLQRGGHNGVLNSAGLRLAGIGRDTPDLEGGFIDRDAAGDPRGWVQDAALERAQHVLPPLPGPALIAGLARRPRVTRRTGSAPCGSPPSRQPSGTPTSAPRPAGSCRPLSRHDDDHARGYLGRRLGGRLPRFPGGAGDQAGAGDGLLRVWGLKFVLDGGVEAAAMTRPYDDRPGYLGELMWDRDALAAALAACARRGWPVGTHAMGDHAVVTLLEATGDAREQVPDAPVGTFVIEHGGLIAGHIARAVGLGVHVTVQQALLDGLARPSSPRGARSGPGRCSPGGSWLTPTPGSAPAPTIRSAR